MVLDINDIQGNILKAYGHYNLPKARYVFLEVSNPLAGQKFVDELTDIVTRAGSWSDANPDTVTTNMAFSYQGLKALGIPRKSLISFPDEFSAGMKARSSILGDEGKSGPQHWDPIWNDPDKIHIWVSINGRTTEDVITRYQELLNLIDVVCANYDGSGVRVLEGHIGDDGESYPYQDAAALEVNGFPTRKEHFGYDDGISDPYFKGCGSDPAYMIGGGKPSRACTHRDIDPASAEAWEPLETGEFILGHRDESTELPIAPIPHDLSKNGSFMVYRKLHENVHSFKEYLENVGKDYPDGPDALGAKMIGRWKDGAPLASFPTEKEAKEYGERYQAAYAKLGQGGSEAEKAKNMEAFQALDKQLRAFNFSKDISGGRCPVGAHTRRTNPRGALEFGKKDAFDTPGALIDRRRILRRGLPYGKYQSKSNSDKGNHGIIFMAINASIKRQFEFVQQQWVNYGNDFKLANDRDPVLGNQPINPNTGKGDGRMVIEGEKGKRAPFFCGNIPSFVETRGGEYFFIPSITALEMIGQGVIDPT